MFATMLFMLTAGIGLAQAVSDPRQVTLRWLRLGGLIALALTGAAWAAAALGPAVGPRVWLQTLPAGVMVIGQLLTVQLGRQEAQRSLALGTFIAAGHAAGVLLGAAMQAGEGVESAAHALGDWAMPALIASVGVSGGLMGVCLMTMLLGHAYLTSAAEMTQRPFHRLVLVLAGLLALRAAVSLGAGLGPWWFMARDSTALGDVPAFARAWQTMVVTARYGVGLIVPGLFAYMTWDCVRRRSNQSATGILYVATVLVLVGEGMALALLDATRLPF